VWTFVIYVYHLYRGWLNALRLVQMEANHLSECKNLCFQRVKCLVQIDDFREQVAHKKLIDSHVLAPVFICTICTICTKKYKKY